MFFKQKKLEIKLPWFCDEKFINNFLSYYWILNKNEKLPKELNHQKQVEIIKDFFYATDNSSLNSYELFRLIHINNKEIDFLIKKLTHLNPELIQYIPLERRRAYCLLNEKFLFSKNRSNFFYLTLLDVKKIMNFISNNINFLDDLSDIEDVINFWSKHQDSNFKFYTEPEMRKKIIKNGSNQLILNLITNIFENYPTFKKNEIIQNFYILDYINKIYDYNKVDNKIETKIHNSKIESLVHLMLSKINASELNQDYNKIVHYSHNLTPFDDCNAIDFIYDGLYSNPNYLILTYYIKFKQKYHIELSNKEINLLHKCKYILEPYIEDLI